MPIDLKAITEHDMSDNCPVRRAQDIVDAVLLPAAAAMIGSWIEHDTQIARKWFCAMIEAEVWHKITQQADGATTAPEVSCKLNCGEIVV